MSKSMVVTLPLVLLLLDWWPLSRINFSAGWPAGPTMWKLLREKLPFFLLALIFGILTIFAQKASGAVKDVETYPVFFRLGNAVLSCAIYLVQTLWPASLSAFYPFPKTLPALELVGAFLLLIALTVSVSLARQRR